MRVGHLFHFHNQNDRYKRKIACHYKRMGHLFRLRNQNDSLYQGVGLSFIQLDNVGVSNGRGPWKR